MDHIIAQYFPITSEVGYKARVIIQSRQEQSGRRTIGLDYTHTRDFAEMNDAISMGFRLVRRWREKYAAKSYLLIEPHTE